MDELIKQFSSDKNPLKVATLFVRDIPYGDIGSRNPQDILEKNMGTCSGKHFLLKEIYEKLGYETQDMIALHKFNNLDIDINQKLQKVLDQHQIPDPHNYLRVKRSSEEKWVDIDITWDKPLAKVGLEINEDWDGASDMRICVEVEEAFVVNNGLDYKKDYISKLPEDVQEIRREFIKEFGLYLAEVRDQ